MPLIARNRTTLSKPAVRQHQDPSPQPSATLSMPASPKPPENRARVPVPPTPSPPKKQSSGNRPNGICEAPGNTRGQAAGKARTPISGPRSGQTQCSNDTPKQGLRAGRAAMQARCTRNSVQARRLTGRRAANSHRGGHETQPDGPGARGMGAARGQPPILSVGYPG